MILEACVETIEDLMNAKDAGVDRIELNSALVAGGLTPSLFMLKKAIDLGLSTIVMIRVRADDFYFSDCELNLMLEEAVILLDAGADGIAFGALAKDREIDKLWTERFINIAHEKGKIFVFHRAIDQVGDYNQAIEWLIDFGCDRILTSGQGKNVEEGIDNLIQAQKLYGDRIEILPGAGITEINGKEIVEKIGASQLHGSFSSYVDLPYQSYVSFGVYSDTQKKKFNKDKYMELKSKLKGS